MVAVHPISDPRCAHCHNEVPSGSVFCCAGCATVYEVLKAKGLGRYYDLRGDIPISPAKTTQRDYLDFDDTAFRDKYTLPRAPGRQHVDLYLEGVHCAACLWLVEKVLKDEPGVIDARLDLGKSTVAIDWDPARTELSTLGRDLDRLGYPPYPAASTDRRAARKREDRKLLVRIAVAGACFGNAMLMALALYGGLFAGIEAEFSQLFRWGSLLVAIPTLLYSATPFYRGAIGSIRARVPHMDLPIAVGLTLGSLAGLVNTVRGDGEIYFDSLTALVFLLLSGRWLQAKEQRRATDAAELLYSLAPATARLADGREVPAENVQPGTLLEVRPSEVIPADGVITQGASSLDLSILTGESRPVEVELGASVSAGTLNLTHAIIIRAEKSGSSSRMGRLLALVEEAAEHRAPIVLEADKLAARFVVRVLVLAAITLVVWLFVDPAHAVDHTIALLVVSCPCALALATPLAVSAAIGQAARAGIFIKGGDTLERLARPAEVWFDKTGTLTEGAQEVVDERGEALAGAALARATQHPVSRAIARKYPRATAPSDAKQTLGGGVEGTIEGTRYALGSPHFILDTKGARIEGALDDARQEWARRGLTPVLVADLDARVVIGAFAVADTTRPDAAASIARLRALGYSPGILSGDDPLVVAEIGREVGITRARGGVSPEAKLATIAASRGPVIMIGDGANDAAALSRADVGIAVFGGTEASLGAAHVFLRRPGLAPVVDAFEGSRRALRVIRRNMRLSLVYNLVGVTLAALGLIGPLGAAILMPLSSLTVVISSYRSRMFRRSP